MNLRKYDEQNKVSFGKELVRKNRIKKITIVGVACKIILRSNFLLLITKGPRIN